MVKKLYKKHFFNYVLLVTLSIIFSVFNISLVHAKDVQYTPDTMFSPDVIAMSKQCRKAEAWAKVQSASNPLDKNKSTLYNKCISLGYCVSEASAHYNETIPLNGSILWMTYFRWLATGDSTIVGPPAMQLMGMSINNIADTKLCKNAFSNVTEQDCKNLDSTIRKYKDSNANFTDENVLNSVHLFTVCTHKKMCGVSTSFMNMDINCNSANKSKNPPKQNGGVDNSAVSKAAKDILKLSLCQKYYSMGQYISDECNKDVDNAVDKCVDNMQKKYPRKQLALSDINNCLQKDKYFKPRWKLPNNFDFNANNFDDSNNPDDSDQKKCYDNAGLFGFFWCPGLTVLTGTLDSLIGLITGGLKWTILANTSTSSKVSGTAQDVLINSWQKMVAVANIVIAVLFLVMLYSYAINANDALKAYTAKKLLSRLIIVTIAVNLSFYICAALADLSNLAGTGIYDLINKIIGDTTGLYSKGNLLDEISGVIAGAALIAIALMSLQAASLALLIILALISLRQIALVVLVIISPIAFACYLLPNTEKWFKHWWDAYVRLLIVYPMFMAVWVSSRLMLALLQDLGQNDLIKTALASVAPLLAIIPIFKISGSIMGRMTSGLQGSAKKHGLTDRASKNDAARRQRAKNFARRKSIALQNNLARRSSAAKAAGNTGAGLIAGGMSVIISHLNGTRAAAADQREQVKRDNLMKDTTKSINKAYDKKLKEKRDDDVTAKMPDIDAQAATADNEIADNQVAQVANTVGTPAITTSTSTGKPTLAGSVMVKYMAMTGKDLSGKQLDSTTYQSVIRYANAHNILNNSELNTALYNVQKNGDKLVRDEFITDYSKNNKTPLFANKKTQKDFIEQTGDFSKENLTSIDKVVEARNKARKSFIDTMDVDTYVNLHQEQRVSLIEQSKQNRDVTSIKNIVKVNNLVSDYSNVKSLPPITLKHTENIKQSLAGWNKGVDDGKWRSWK